MANQSAIGRWCGATMLVCAMACTRGNRYDEEARVASSFARAVAQHDTVGMRELSTPVAGSRMAMALREIPPMYTDFGGDSPTVVRQGSPQSTNFFVASRSLRACHGGLLISVTPGETARVSWIRLEPEAGAAGADACPE